MSIKEDTVVSKVDITLDFDLSGESIWKRGVPKSNVTSIYDGIRKTMIKDCGFERKSQTHFVKRVPRVSAVREAARLLFILFRQEPDLCEFATNAYVNIGRLEIDILPIVSKRNSKPPEHRSVLPLNKKRLELIVDRFMHYDRDLRAQRRIKRMVDELV